MEKLGEWIGELDTKNKAIRNKINEIVDWINKYEEENIVGGKQ